MDTLPTATACFQVSVTLKTNLAKFHIRVVCQRPSHEGDIRKRLRVVCIIVYDSCQSRIVHAYLHIRVYASLSSDID